MRTRFGPAWRVASDRAKPTDDGSKIIPFRPRDAIRPERRAQPAAPRDVGQYERGDVEDDYRHRMLMNLAGLAVTIMLATAGAWLAITIADMRKNQDCYLSGRRNCTPIDVQSLSNG